MQPCRATCRSGAWFGGFVERSARQSCTGAAEHHNRRGKGPPPTRQGIGIRQQHPPRAGSGRRAAVMINPGSRGAWRLTGAGIWGEPADPEGAREVLVRAVGLGVNFIDTADSYGPEVSERLIGETLHPYPQGLVIATKGGLTRPGPSRWVPNGRPEHLRQACEGSLRRLRL